MKAVVFASVIGLSMISLSPLQAGQYGRDTPFGPEGSGQPTNTVLGILAGVATGAAIGSVAGGDDGLLIGSIVGGTLGGVVGNSARTSGPHPQRAVYRSYGRSSYGPRSYHPSFSRNYCPPRARRVVYVEPAVYEPVHYERETVYTSDAPAALPYGFILPGGKLQSPWSDVEMDLGGLKRGQQVFDAKTGQAFLVP